MPISCSMETCSRTTHLSGAELAAHCMQRVEVFCFRLVELADLMSRTVFLPMGRLTAFTKYTSNRNRYSRTYGNNANRRQGAEKVCMLALLFVCS